jgi:hypothetical protein
MGNVSKPYYYSQASLNTIYETKLFFFLPWSCIVYFTIIILVAPTLIMQLKAQHLDHVLEDIDTVELTKRFNSEGLERDKVVYINGYLCHFFNFLC